MPAPTKVCPVLIIDPERTFMWDLEKRALITLNPHIYPSCAMTLEDALHLMAMIQYVLIVVRMRDTPLASIRPEEMVKKIRSSHQKYSQVPIILISREKWRDDRAAVAVMDSFSHASLLERVHEVAPELLVP